MNGSYLENEKFNDIKLDGEVLSDYEFVFIPTSTSINQAVHSHNLQKVFP